MYLSINPDFIFTLNPYGRKNGFSNGLSLNIQRVTKENIIFGFNTGYQTNKSKILINGVSISEGTSTTFKYTNGQTYITNNAVLANPFFGYRFEINNIPIDLVGGINFDFILNTKENGTAKDSNNVDYITSIDRKTINLDVSPKIQLSTKYKKFGILVGYSTGFVNYKRGYDVNPNYGKIKEVYSKNDSINFTFVLWQTILLHIY